MDTGNQDRTVPTVARPRLGDRCRPELPDLIGHLIFWPTLLAGLAADLGTKQAVFAWLDHKPHQMAEIIDGILTFRLALNMGAAFGIASGHQPLLVVVSAIALLIILGAFLLIVGRQRVVQVSLGLFAAGVSGNLWDRLFNGGQVRDFVDVGVGSWRWHTFNVADAMLCVAVGLLVLATLLTDSSDRTRVPPQK
jgi:signal peptidase II